MKVNWNDGVVFHHVENFEFILNDGHPMCVFKFLPGSEEASVRTNGEYIEYVVSLDCSFSIGDDDE